MTPRVVYILYRYPQLSQTFVRDEVDALRRAGVRVDVVSLDDPGPDQPDPSWSGPYHQADAPTRGAVVRGLAWAALRRPRAALRLVGMAAAEPNRRRYLMTRAPALARHLADGGACHVHTHFAWDTATVASAVAGLLGASSSITVHAKDIYAQPVTAVRRRLSRFGRVVTVCTFNVGYLLGNRTVGRAGTRRRGDRLRRGGPGRGPGAAHRRRRRGRSPDREEGLRRPAAGPGSATGDVGRGRRSSATAQSARTLRRATRGARTHRPGPIHRSPPPRRDPGADRPGAAVLPAGPAGARW